MELISVEQEEELVLGVSLPNPCSDTHGFLQVFPTTPLLLTNSLVSQPCALSMRACVYLMLLPVCASLCIYRKREEERSPTESLALLPATRCCAVCYSYVRESSILFNYQAITWHLSSPHVPVCPVW